MVFVVHGFYRQVAAGGACCAEPDMLVDPVVFQPLDYRLSNLGLVP